jgi:hypothetical protein
MIDDTTVGRTTEVTKVLPERTVDQRGANYDSRAITSPSRIRTGELPSRPLVAHGLIQPLGLVAAINALEDGDAPAADRLEEARPHGPPRLRELQGAMRDAWLSLTQGSMAWVSNEPEARRRM